MSYLNAAEIAILRSPAPRISYCFRLDTPEPLRLWSGSMHRTFGPNLLDPEGGRYLAFKWASLPAFRQLINNAGERLEFVLSPVSKQIADIAARQDAPAVMNRDCSAGFVLFDPDWQPAGPIHWPGRFVCDYLGTSFVGASDTNSQSTYAVKLSVGNGFTDRKRRGYQYWTHPDITHRSPTDMFGEFVAKLVAGVSKAWPPA